MSQPARPWAKHRGESEWLDDLEGRLTPYADGLPHEARIAIQHLRTRVKALQDDLRDSERDGQRAARDAFAEGRWAEREDRGDP